MNGKVALVILAMAACSTGPAPPGEPVRMSPTATPAPPTGTPASPTATRQSPTCTPGPTATTWPMSPIATLVGYETLDKYRIWDGFGCGGSAHDCMWDEPDALVMARIAIGEAPDSVNDQVYVMWLVRLRSELGFKNNKYSHGWCGTDWCYRPGRWGEPTTIKQEALCYEGCQFSPARVAERVYYPCRLSGVDPMRKMLCPTDNQLADFGLTVRAAEEILAAPLTDFPVELYGYDNFRSPQITGEGQHNRLGGLLSKQFWPGGNVWRDEFLDDNLFWWPPVLTPTPTSARLGATQ